MSVCCCGTRNGNVVLFYRCKPTSRVFPFVCMLGPDWHCLVCTYALILVPSVAFAYLMYVSPLLTWAVVGTSSVPRLVFPRITCVRVACLSGVAASAGKIHVGVLVVELLLLLSTITALSMTACSDPGVMFRNSDLEAVSAPTNSAQAPAEESERLTTVCRTCDDSHRFTHLAAT